MKTEEQSDPIGEGTGGRKGDHGRTDEGGSVLKNKHKLPSGWKNAFLGEVVKFGSGTTKPQDISQVGGDGMNPVYGGNGIIGYSSHSNSDGPEIVIGRVGEKCGCVHLSEKACWVTDNALRIKELYGEIHHIFLVEALMWARLERFRAKGGQPLITQEGIGVVPILLPPLPEQKAIADLLSTWDEAIEKTEQLIRATDRKLRKMSRRLIFGHGRLGNQNRELVNGTFFKYPLDWGLEKIGNVAQEISLRSGDSEEIVLSCSKYDGLVNSLDYFGKQVFSSDTSNYKVVERGQFAYPSNHVEEGSIGLLEHCGRGIVSPIYVVFEASSEKVHPPYLFRLLKTDIYRQIFQISTSSSVDRRGSLRWAEFSRIKVLVPPLEEQKRIADVLSTVEHEINLLRQLSENYKTHKRGLMQKLLTGEWRVSPKIVNQYMEV